MRGGNRDGLAYAARHILFFPSRDAIWMTALGADKEKTKEEERLFLEGVLIVLG